MRRIKTTLLFLVLLGGLIPAISSAQCSALFSTSVSGSTVTITNSSSNYNSLNWSYGDSTYSTNYSTTHTKTYNSSGTYLICLTVSDTATSCTHTYCDTVVVTVAPPPGCNAAYTYSVSGNTVSFTNNSTGYASYYWSFGDSSPLNYSFNPTHTYSSAGTYFVCLFISDSNQTCMDSVCYSITVSGSSGSSCNANFSHTTSGSTASFTNTSSNNTYNTWYFGDGSSSQATSPSHTYSSSGTYTVCLIIQDSGQTCVDSICKAVTVTGSGINCAANFSFNVSGSTASFTNASSNIVTNSWSFGDGSVSSATSPSHTYTSSGIYTVCLTIWDSTQTCSDSICKQVSINTGTPCAAGFTFTTNALNVNFNNTSTGGSLGVSYTWNLGNGTIHNGSNISYTYPQAGTYIVCLSMMDSSTNCSSTYCDTVVVSTTGANCKASFTTQTSGGMVFLTNTSTPGTGGITWSWSMGDGTSLWTKNPTHQYQQNGLYVICLTMYDSLTNCQSTYCDSVLINLNPRPCKASFYVIQDSINTNQYYFNNTSTPNFGLTYQWVFSDGTVYNTKHVNRTFTQPGNYTVCLYITDSLNQCSDSTCTTIKVNAPTTCDAKFTFNSSNKVVSFTNQSIPNSGSVTYSWNFGDATAGSSSKNPTHTYANYGTYHVCLTIVDSSSNCWDTYCDTVVLMAPVPCVADFSIIDSNGTFVFINNSTPANQLNFYQWSFGDGNTSNQMNPTHQYSAPGTYTVCLYVEDSLRGCNDSTCKSVTVNALSTNLQAWNSSSVQVFPNPFDNQINIKWSEGMDEVSIRLYDLTGKAMPLETALSVEQGQTHTLDLSAQSLSSGVYYLEIATNYGKSTYPVYKR